MKEKIEKKEHGFTLIELLAVILVLGLILFIVFGGIGKIIDLVKGKSDDVSEKSIKEAITLYSKEDNKGENGEERWIDNTKDSEDNNLYFCTSVQELINKGLIAKDAKLPADVNNSTVAYVTKNKNNKVSKSPVLCYGKDKEKTGCTLCQATLPPVPQEESCKNKEYTNYYFYLYIGTQQDYVENFEKTHYTYFASLVNNPKTDDVDKQGGKVCITKDNNDTTPCYSSDVETWTISTYYERYQNTIKSKEVEVVNVEGHDYKSHVLTEGNTKYISHGGFYTENNTEQRFATDDEFSSANGFIEGAIAATVLPIQKETEIQMDLEDNYYKGTITRKPKLPAASEIKFYNAKWKKEDQQPKDTFFIPAVYKVTYTICPNQKS